MGNIAKVKVREPHFREAFIAVSDGDKPQLPMDVIENWQKLLNLVAKLVNIPSALIMRIHSTEIEVFMKDDGKPNPYGEHESANLGDGLYCETVLGNRKELFVPNSLEDDTWKENPDIELNMISYYGLPIEWPDAQLFGTICVLDSKTLAPTDVQKGFIAAVREIIQKDLRIVMDYRAMEAQLTKQERINKEMVHRVKNNFNSLLNFCSIQKANDDSANKLQEKLMHYVSLFEQLTYNSEGDAIILNDFITALTSKIISGSSDDIITADVTGDKLEIDPEKASLIGQILSELTTNTLKHAYDDSHLKRNISIITAKRDKVLNIAYMDHGLGFSQRFFDSQKQSIGWQILLSIVEAMHGTIAFTPGPGGIVNISLPLL